MSEKANPLAMFPDGNAPSHQLRRSRSFDREPGSGWTGLVVFAGIMMIIAGGLHVIEGITALFRDSYYPSSGRLAIRAGYSGWGGVHAVVGLLILIAGVCVLAGLLWARIVGVLVVGASALLNMAFLPAHPAWSIIAIVLDVLIIYGLLVHGSELKSERP